MNTLFFIAGSVALVSAVMAVSRANAIHALLYLVVSLLSTGIVFFVLGAPFAAALEVIIYAGAIMVLVVFVVMMLNPRGSRGMKKAWIGTGAWAGPVILTLILAVELVYAVGWGGQASRIEMIGPGEVSASLFGPYVLGVEIASMLLLSALVGAFHLAGRTGINGKTGGGRQ
jgi:NADH-quinone oxidoreductase subunit J